MTAPLPGPLETAPEVTDRQAAAMLGEALAGVELGAWDRQALERIRFAPPPVTAAMASLLRRAWTEGVAVGRGEREEEEEEERA